MTKKVFNMEGGLHSAAAYAAFENRLYGSCKATPASFVLSAGSGLDVNISSGDGLIDTGDDFARRIQSTATETVTANAGHASYNRIDSVVAYIDMDVDPTTSVVDNTNGILKFAIVAGTAAASPVKPTDAAIQAAIGAANPYLVLGQVTVPQNAVNLGSATFANTAPTPLLKAYPIGAVYESVDNTNPSSLFGGTWAVFGTGRVTVGYDAGQTEFDTVEETGGAKTHQHPLGDSGYAKFDPVGGGGPHLARQVDTATYATTVTVTGSASSSANSTNQAIGLGGVTDSATTLQPYVVVYRWKRTA